MSTITKTVDRNLGSPYRNVSFSRADADAGDIIDVEGSLGRPANNCTIVVSQFDMSIRFNVNRTIYPTIQRREGFMHVDHLPYLSSGVNYVDTTVATINMQAGSTYEWEDDFAIRDMQLVTVSGQYDAFFS
jgi:hypothetical protein